MSFILPNQFYALVSLGSLPGIVSFFKVGSNTNIPSTTFIILSNVTSATFISNFPAVSQQMQVVSTSASDTAAGTGAQQVTIDYLTEPASVFKFTRFREIVTLNGTTPVNTVATNINRIERFRVSKTGTGAVAAGNISLQSVGGATTFERIDSGENVHRTAVHFVPNGFMSIITDIFVGTTTSGGVRFAITIVEDDGFGNVVRIGQEEVGFSQGSLNQALNLPVSMTNPGNKRLSFAITTRGQAANQSGQGSFAAIDIPL